MSDNELIFRNSRFSGQGPTRSKNLRCFVSKTMERVFGPQPDRIFKMCPTVDDGRSLFRSIAVAAAHSRGRQLSEEMHSEVTEYYRAVARSELSSIRTAGCEKELSLHTDSQVCIKSGGNISVCPNQLELLVLADFLHRPIEVFQMLDEHFVSLSYIFGDGYEGDARTGHRDGRISILLVGECYQALLPRRSNYIFRSFWDV